MTRPPNLQYEALAQADVGSWHWWDTSNGGEARRLQQNIMHAMRRRGVSVRTKVTGARLSVQILRKEEQA